MFTPYLAKLGASLRTTMSSDSSHGCVSLTARMSLWTARSLWAMSAGANPRVSLWTSWMHKRKPRMSLRTAWLFEAMLCRCT